MKRATQNDLRYIKTENLIQQTFRDMILEMDYPQISIKDLTERAMINRKTFYLHYNTLDELLGTLQIELYNNFLKTIADIKLPGDLEKLMQKLFIFYANTSKAIEKILCSRGHFPEEKALPIMLGKKYSTIFILSKPLRNTTHLKIILLTLTLTAVFFSFIFNGWQMTERYPWKM